jgi:hypothetical protein
VGIFNGQHRSQLAPRPGVVVSTHRLGIVSRLLLAVAFASSVPMHGTAQAFTPAELALLDKVESLWEDVQGIRRKLKKLSIPLADAGADVDCTGNANACTFSIQAAQEPRQYLVDLHNDYNAETVMVSSDKNCSVSPGLTLGVPTTQLVGSNPARLSVYVDADAACTIIVGERVVPVANGANLQTAIDAAVPGDTLLLASGAAWTGSFFLDAGLTGWVKLKCADTTTTLTSNDGAGALQTEALTRYWYVENCTFNHGAGVRGSDMIRVGTHVQLDSEIPEYFVFDNIQLAGHATLGGRFGIKLHSGYTKIINSECTNLRYVGADSNCIGGWNGPGPYIISNNDIQSCGYGLMFGGADPSIANMLPNGVTVTLNSFSKPAIWETEDLDPNTAGTQLPSCKNLIEFKAGLNITIRYNTFTRNWQSASSTHGAFAWFKSVNQDAACNWCEVRNLDFSYNVATEVGSGFALSPGQNGNGGTYVPMSNVSITHNYIEIDPVPFVYTEASAGKTFFTMTGVHNLTIANNTIRQVSNGYGRNVEFDTAGAPSDNTANDFIFRDNIWHDSDLGVRGPNAGEGTETLELFAPGYIFTNNLRISAGGTGTYPNGNYTETSLTNACFDTGTRLFSAGCKYLSLASDGSAIGWDGTGGDQ